MLRSSTSVICLNSTEEKSFDFDRSFSIFSEIRPNDSSINESLQVGEEKERAGCLGSLVDPRATSHAQKRLQSV